MKRSIPVRTSAKLRPPLSEINPMAGPSKVKPIRMIILLMESTVALVADAQLLLI
jgi:hypothetical protein